MTVAAAALIPIILLFQAWTYPSRYGEPAATTPEARSTCSRAGQAA